MSNMITERTPFGIQPDRTLSTQEARTVRRKFVAWYIQRVPRDMIGLHFGELRWSDDYRYLWVNRASGLLACGFDSLYPEHRPLAESESWAIYSSDNPAAHALLVAIEEATS